MRTYRPNIIRRFLRNERGNIAIMFAVGLLPIMATIGLGVDVARAYAVKSRMGAALDAAALAVGSSSGTNLQLQAVAQKFFDANYPPGTLGASPTVAVTVNGDTISAQAHSAVATAFMGVLGINQLSVQATSVVQRQIAGLELAMVLDNTGSMTTNNNIQAVRDAAAELTDILFGGLAVHPNLKIALVPYSAAVNPGSVAPSLITTGDTYAPNDLLGWKGCVVERAGTNGTGDTPASTAAWTRYKWLPAVDNVYDATKSSTVLADPSHGNASTGPNLGCPTPITPLTNVKATLTPAITAMQAWSRGGTLSDVGMAWGLRVLSPEAPFTEGLPWNTPKWSKAAILMTDGDNQFYKLTSTAGSNKVNSAVNSDYTAYGRLDELGRIGTTNATTAKTTINTRLTSVCNAMKAKGIIVYTVTFTSGINQATKDIYKSCATDTSKYFDSPSQDELKSAFRAIATSLSNLRLTQ
ncbi:Flp pilus assembly protein TadG [Candidatus Terasakiella magnetica]|nr:Flp pilus assembly protein TadG [Candidatus Terasakiella magnetica]